MTTIDIDPNDLVDAERYTRGYPHTTWETLRRHSPVHWCQPDGFPPFWAVTRHSDIKQISTQPDLFPSSPRVFLLRDTLERQGFGTDLRTLVNMDPPEHRDYRAIAAPFFRASALRALEARMRDIARLLVDRTASPESFDLVTEIAARFPLKVICDVLGAEPDDEDIVLDIATTALGLEDPEFKDNIDVLQPRMMEYYDGLMKGRKEYPTDDLYSALVNAEVGGEPIGWWELMSYFLIMTTAGHDTTRNAISGGIHALIEHPDQLDILREQPELCARAADEFVRWSSPVVVFCRTATEDTEIGGQLVRAGDLLALFYPSANRDEEVFDDPFAFRVDRDPNPHVGFGFGEHYCVGANLARMEIRVLLEELVPRLETIELAGEPQRAAAMLVSGFKHMPVRWALSTG